MNVVVIVTEFCVNFEMKKSFGPSIEFQLRIPLRTRDNGSKFIRIERT